MTTSLSFAKAAHFRADETATVTETHTTEGGISEVTEGSDTSTERSELIKNSSGMTHIATVPIPNNNKEPNSWQGTMGLIVDEFSKLWKNALSWIVDFYESKIQYFPTFIGNLFRNFVESVASLFLKLTKHIIRGLIQVGTSSSKLLVDHMENEVLDETQDVMPLIPNLSNNTEKNG